MNTPQVKPSSPFRIAILICYYGKLPWYFRFFLNSCAYNPDIDFIFVSDIDLKEPLPPNVIVAKRTLEEIKKTAEQKFGFEVSLNKPYKICDFRPAFGVLFADLIAGYDFYGYGDIDVIYGRIRDFITDDILSQYDAISVRPQYFTGFLAVLKNTEKITSIYLESRDYKKVFQSPYSYCFDEMNWHWEELMLGKSIFQIKAEVQSMTYIVNKLTICGKIRSYFGDFIEERCDGKLVWDKGTLTYNGKEIMLFHFYDYKSQFFIYIPPWKKMPEKYFVYPFYFLTFPPTSIMGMLMGVLVKAFKGAYYFSARYVQFMQWLIKYVSSSRKLKNNQIDHLHEWLGTYKGPPDNTIEIKLVGDKLYGEWQQKTLRLLHRKNNKFLVSKFSVTTSFDIDVEFYYDKEKSVHAVSVAPYRINKMVLFKV